MKLLLGALFLILCCLGCDSRWYNTVPPTPPAPGVTADAATDAGTCDDALPHPDDCIWPSPAPGARVVQICGDQTTSHIALCYMVDTTYQPIVGRTDCWLGGYYCVFPCPVAQ